jgi:hypothetical protein
VAERFFGITAVNSVNVFFFIVTSFSTLFSVQQVDIRIPIAGLSTVQFGQVVLTSSSATLSGKARRCSTLNPNFRLPHGCYHDQLVLNDTS